MPAAFFAERQKMAQIFVWDLDDTVITSRHRQQFLECGKLDLSHWIENHTPENVWKDNLLPLAKVMRNSLCMEKQGFEIKNIIITARDMRTADYDFLEHHGLRAGLVLERGKASQDHYKLADAEYKRQWLEVLGFNPAHVIAYDDMPDILSMYRGIGAQAFDAKRLNMAMGHKY